ncbi:MAG: chemotaxis protein CheB, partial [Chloroflexota bacterium]|nr:chemotaxis protein CheB [Chloroflexota bacterium]
DEASSIIYGMPKVAAATGKVDFILPPERIADKITELVQRPDPHIWANDA